MTSESQPREGLLPIGTTLANGKYRIVRYLASGGFGNTYEAIDTAFDEKVAIKELFIKGVCGRQDNTADVSITLTENKRKFQALQEKFRKEARRLRRLDNPHIVRVHDLFDENATTYYVMDYIEGESLSARLKRTNHPMGEAEVMALLDQLLDALETVHREGIWHLDLKPANVMVDTNGCVQLIDFGASKQMRSADGDSLSTSSALTCTPGYAPSEQMEQNIDKFGPWTDLYSLGATLFNLLTRQQPPAPSDIDEDADNALRLPSGTSRRMQQLVMWLMKPNRQMRPQNVADVRAFLAETPAEGRKPAAQAPRATSDGDTVLRPKATAAKPTQTATSEDKESDGGKTSTKSFLAILFVVLAVVGGTALMMKACNGQTGKGGNADSIQDSTVVEVIMKHVTNLPVIVTEGPSNMREYTFTGEIADSIGALPQGHGTAHFKKQGNTAAATYDGEFTDGLCNDQSGTATLKFENGDSYVGTFNRGYYDNGTYTVSDGSCFKGTYRDGQPYDGTWYDTDGSVLAQVKNGKM